MANALIHLGIAKTGATSLQQQLFSEEQVFYPMGRYGVGGDLFIDETIRELVSEGVCLDNPLVWQDSSNSI